MATFTGAGSVHTDETFKGRIVVGLALTAEKVLEESGSTPFHSDRVVLAKKVIEKNLTAIDAATSILIAINYASLDVNAPDKGLTDTAIEAAVAAQWNTLAGVDQATATQSR